MPASRFLHNFRKLFARRVFAAFAATRISYAAIGTHLPFARCGYVRSGGGRFSENRAKTPVQRRTGKSAKRYSHREDKEIIAD